MLASVQVQLVGAPLDPLELDLQFQVSQGYIMRPFLKKKGWKEKSKTKSKN